MLTFSVVAAENLLFLAYPVFGGWAVDAVMHGNVWQALSYALLVWLMWFVGAVRRSADTRVFARIYSELAVPVIVEQRVRGQSPSAIAARVALSREFVNFFEEHLPTALTSMVSVFGASLMLLVLAFWSGVLSVVILLVFALLLPRFSRIGETLYRRLNNRLERDVDMIRHAGEPLLHKHYGLIARLRILISNREAAGYLAVGTAMAVLFGFTLAWLTLNGYGSAGHVYSLTTYLWMFAMSLDDVPRLVESYTNLKDIAQRIDCRSAEQGA